MEHALVIVIEVVVVAGGCNVDKVNRYVLYINKRCNLDCLYCYVDKKEEVLSVDELKRLIDRVFASVEGGQATIEFIGGEPLMDYRMVEVACDYIAETYSSIAVDFILTSNGTIINDNIINMLNKYEINLFISIDGTRLAHMHRPYKGSHKGSYDKVIENAKIFLEKLAKRPSVQMTTHKYNIHLLSSGVDYLYRLGVRKISIGVAKRYTDKDFYNIYYEEHCKILKNNALKELKLAPMMNKYYDGLFMFTEYIDGDKCEHYKLKHIATLEDDLRMCYETILKVRNKYLEVRKNDTINLPL